MQSARRAAALTAHARRGRIIASRPHACPRPQLPPAVARVLSAAAASPAAGVPDAGALMRPLLQAAFLDGSPAPQAQRITPEELEAVLAAAPQRTAMQL